MASFAPLFPLEKQFQAKDGRNNTGGWLKVYLAATDDLADTYSDYLGTRNPERIVLDDNGRATVICDKAKAYRLEVYDISGALLWTEEPVYCSGTGGGGVSVTRVISTDGSIGVESSTEGSVTTYDIGMAPADSDEFLEWVKCSSENIANGNWYPVYVEGSMETYPGQGLHVGAGKFYHMTATVKVDPTGSGVNYETLSANLEFNDGTETSHVTRRNFDIDNSCNDPVLCEFSYDFKPEADGYVYLDIEGVNAFEPVSVELQVHRIYSGINAVPDTCATKQWVEEYYSELSRDTQSDWTENDSTKPSYIKHRPDLSLYVTDTELDTILDGYATTTELSTGLAGKQDVLTAGSNIQLNGSTISATDTTYTAGNGLELSGTEFSVDTTEIQEKLTAGTGITIGDDGVISVNESAINGIFPVTYNVTTFNEIRTALIAGKLPVLYKGDPEELAVRVQRIPIYEFFDGGTYKYAQFWTPDVYVSPSAAYPPYADFDVFSASYDTGTGTTTWSTLHKYFAEQSDWAEVDAKKLTFIKNKPDLSVYATQTDLTNGLATKQDTISDLSDIRAGAQAGSTAVQPATLNDYVTNSALATTLADYVTDTELGTILEGYQTALTAGSNIQISNGTISATDTTYTAGTALSLTGTEFSVKVDGTTVTVNASGELQAAPAITVDQTYDATSTNPQSGTAVAQAVAGVDTTLFQAEYGVTPFADIAAAITAKKVVYCKVSPLQNSSRMAFLAYYKLAGNSTDHIEFQYYRSNSNADGADSVFIYDVTRGDVWTTTERVPQKAADWNAEAGAFNSIANKPDLSVYATTASLGAVAFSNDYDDLDNKPVIPVLPATKDLVAGNNITLTEGNDDVTVACSITIGVVTV